jgi:MoaA/NifB/PqqE/SkfB family radical SAM enzyme
MNDLIIAPTTLSIITTYRCTSSCKDCCFQCNPNRQEKLTVSEIKEYISKSVQAYPSIRVLVLTGGECFLYGMKLEDIIKHASSYGLVTRVVTNGFWAKDYNKAKETINRLAVAGLNEINFSTGDDHLEYVFIETIKNGIIASLKHNLITVVNVESGGWKKFNFNSLKEDVALKEFVNNGKLKIINGIWVPFTRSTLNEAKNATQIYKDVFKPYQRCVNIFHSITIDPNHRMIACCGLTSKYIKYLDLGNVNKFPILELYNKQFNDFLKIWIATEGPHKIMDFISKYAILDDTNYKEHHACQVCERIFNNEKYLQIIQTEYKSIYSNVILKHLFNKNQLKHETTE